MLFKDFIASIIFFFVAAFGAFPAVADTAEEQSLAALYQQSISQLINHSTANIENDSHTEFLAKKFVASQLISGVVLVGLSSKQIDALPIPKGVIPKATINGLKLRAPSTFGGLLGYVSRLERAIQNSRFGRVALTLGDESFIVSKESLGKGYVGTAYAIGDMVLKIPHPTFYSLSNIIIERIASTYYESISKREHFSVARRVQTDPLGLFAISKRDFGEPLTSVLFKKGILKIGSAGAEVESDHSKWKLSESDVAKLWLAIKDLSEVMSVEPIMVLSLSPNNLHVTFTDLTEKEIESVALIDFGPTFTKMVPYEDVNLKNLKKIAPRFYELALASGRPLATPEQILKAVDAVPLSLGGRSFVQLNDHFRLKSFDEYLGIVLPKINRYFDIGYVGPTLRVYENEYRHSQCFQAEAQI